MHFTPVVSPCRANLVIQCENWWNLAKQFASRSPPLNFLSSPVQRTLMKALVLGGFAHMDTETKQQYWTEVMEALKAGKGKETGVSLSLPTEQVPANTLMLAP